MSGTYLPKPVLLLILILATGVFSGCNRPEVIADLGSLSFHMLDQDSSSVTFPSDFNGEITVTGFIYTNCPDVCPIITANMKKMFTALDDPSGVQFVLITFDPKRDTPPVLKNYRGMYDLDENHFTLLTGDSTTVDSLMREMDIVVSRADKSGIEDTNTYFLNHTNRVTLIDQRGRIRGEYIGSRVPPEHVIEDINKLR